MKTYIVGKHDDKLTIYSFIPRVHLIKKYRALQMEKIEENDFFYKAIADPNYDGKTILNRFLYGKAKKDSIEALKVGHELVVNKSDRKAPHLLFRAPAKKMVEYFDPEFGMYRTFDDNDKTRRMFLAGKINEGKNQPFRVVFPNDSQETEYFLPTERYHFPNGSKKDYSVMNGILHIPRELYLEQLLNRNRTDLFDQAQVTDEELRQLLDLYVFNRPQEFGLEELEKAEQLVNRTTALVTPENKKPRNISLSRILKEQAIIDEPLIERAEDYIKKLVQ